MTDVDRRSFLSDTAVLALLTALHPSVHWSTARATEEIGGVPLRVIRSRSQFERAGKKLRATVIKGIDLRTFDLRYWNEVELGETFFLGCRFKTKQSEMVILNRGAFVLGRFGDELYDPFRNALYSADELMARTAGEDTRDQAIHKDYLAKGKLTPNLLEGLARRIHDHSMDDGLSQLALQFPPRQMVCVTGGFFQERGDPWFRAVAETARLMARDKKFIVTGGGPGMMEAANLGAYLADYPDSTLDVAIDILKRAPKYTSDGWAAQAAEVKRRFPRFTRNLGIPTWYYGHEPPNIFATDIAKYFDNNIREGVLMTLPKAGFIFAPGSAGMRQEVFMAATQNHFGGLGFFSPMVFLGKHHHQVETHVFQLIQEVANANYKDLLYVTDEPADAARFIRENPPRPSRENK